MDMGIKGKRVLITGASKGIGRVIARAFAAEGAAVVMVARSGDLLAELVEEIGGADLGHGFIAADLLEPEAPSRAARQLLDGFGGFEIVVHNVGGALGAKDPLGPVDDWNRGWQFNVGIPIEMKAVLLPPMVDNGWGRVIHISSTAAVHGELLEPYGGAMPYAAAKAYLNSYVQGLGRELAKHNIVVSALMPGAITSEGKYWARLERENPQLVKRYLDEHHAIGRFGTAEEIAPFAVVMASEQASFACGATMAIDGGRM